MKYGEELLKEIEHLDRWYTDDTFKISMLSDGQIGSILDVIINLRKEQNYARADALKSKLEDVGYYWWMPAVTNTGNLLGHTKSSLKINFSNKEAILEGHIHDRSYRSTEMYWKM